MARRAPERASRLAVGGFAFLGLAVAGYLSVVHLQGATPVCLSGGGGCEAVAESRYADLVGIPVAVWGVLGYALLLASALGRSDLARVGGVALALAGAGFSAYLTYVELWVIDAVCQWCVVSAVLMSLLVATTVLRLHAGLQEDDGAGQG
jgi:uncharacterized membrane protein